MFSRIQSAQLSGISAQGVIVETDISRGLYLFQIVGLANKSVEESRERVMSALRNNCAINPKTNHEKVVVSLSPAELRKEGSYFDLAIAIGYLVASGACPAVDCSGKVFVGELSLNGDLLPINGLLPIARWAISVGMTELYVPAAHAREAALVDGITIYLAPTLADVFHHLIETDTTMYRSVYDPPPPPSTSIEDFLAVRGQAMAQRALMIAAAGAHNIILYGPPGTGKTMLARAFHSLLPPLPNDAFLDVASIHSSVGLIDSLPPALPPIRSPHHTSSSVAVIGGGSTIRAGDITLAHHGVLYLDEFPEFDRRVLEALREPLEEGYITIARSKGSVRFPARFILLAAMNPCPCGYRGSEVQPCTCSGAELLRYRRKLSGPIMDRIDLWVHVSTVAYETLHEHISDNEYAAVTHRIKHARERQEKRQGVWNGLLTTESLRTNSGLATDAKLQLQQYAKRLHLSPRAYLRTIKVARTIADIEGSASIELPHILEALQYRHHAEW